MQRGHNNNERIKRRARLKIFSRKFPAIFIIRFGGRPIALFPPAFCLDKDIIQFRE